MRSVAVSAMIGVMKKYRVVMGVAFVVAALALTGVLLLRGVHFDVLQPAGDIAKQQRNILVFATLLMALVAVPIFIILGIFAWKYREGNDKRKKHDYTPEWHENTKLELLWWGIPMTIIAVLAVTAWMTSHSLDPYKEIESDKKSISVQVVALQWKWLFIYPEYGVATVNQLPIPEKTPINFSLSADAPMSAFWIPSLGSQIYTMNGMSSKLSLIADHAGEFTGYSTNINGKGYADMKFTVRATSDAEFDAWVKKTQGSPNLMNEQQYERIAKPGTMDAASYSLADSKLYATIVNKYMGHGTHTMSDGTIMKDSDIPAGEEHKHHDMEGM